MSSTEELLAAPRARGPLAAIMSRAVASPRLYIYLGCTVVALLTAYHLGKEMLWDTLHYHLYAGYSALHDRFGQDYFAAGPESYLNPYVYVPFYLLATSGLPALAVALILAAAQSAILWMTCELGTAVAPPQQGSTRWLVGALAALLAFENPVLMNQLGSSFADITTAELVVAGWLLLVTTVRQPSTAAIALAGMLLGVATALKLTNSISAVSAVALVCFVRASWRARMRYLLVFCACGLAGSLLVAAPWALHLERQFGNPLFPLFNGIFHSPAFPTQSMADYRFIPTSFVAALVRPFAIVLPDTMIHIENAAPDLRYAVLAVLALALLVRRLIEGRPDSDAGAIGRTPEDSVATRRLSALGCAFSVNWVLWLFLSANSRYFIPMGCVAAVLVVAILFRMLAAYPRSRNYALIAILSLQSYQLYAGTQFHAAMPWRDQPWFDLAVPRSLAEKPYLYFNIGVQSNSFVVPFLAPQSGFINIEGMYTLGPGGANGRRIAELIHKYSPNLRVLVRNTQFDSENPYAFPQAAIDNDALEPFGLRVDTSDCASIAVYGVTFAGITVLPKTKTAAERPVPPYTGYLMSCAVVPDRSAHPRLAAQRWAAELALDHLEDACPTLFQPRRPVTYFLGDSVHGYLFVRRYMNTDILAWVSANWVRFQKIIGDGTEEQYAGPEARWDKGPLKVACGRSPNGDFLKVLQPIH